MQNDLNQILNSYCIDLHSHLFDFCDWYKLPEKKCCFLFDINASRCCYLSPAIGRLFGYNSQPTADWNYLFLQTLISSKDFTFLFTEILTLIKVAEKRAHNAIYVTRKRLPFQGRHTEGYLLKLIINLMYIIGNPESGINLLIGYIEKDGFINGEHDKRTINVTPREKEVLRLIAGGKSAKIIAAELFISETTVITHRKHLIQKLKVKNSAELIKKSFELDLLH